MGHRGQLKVWLSHILHGDFGPIVDSVIQQYIDSYIQCSHLINGDPGNRAEPLCVKAGRLCVNCRKPYHPATTMNKGPNTVDLFFLIHSDMMGDL